MIGYRYHNSNNQIIVDNSWYYKIVGVAEHILYNIRIGEIIVGVG